MKVKKEDLYAANHIELLYEESQGTGAGMEVSKPFIIPGSRSNANRRLVQLRKDDYQFDNVFKRYISVIRLKSTKGIDFLRIFIYNVYCKVIKRKGEQFVKNNTTTTPNTNDNKAKPNAQKWSKSAGRVIMGLAKLFVIVSITYSAAVILLGTEDIINRLMLVPMALWALAQTLNQFIKQGDK